MSRKNGWILFSCDQPRRPNQLPSPHHEFLLTLPPKQPSSKELFERIEMFSSLCLQPFLLSVQPSFILGQTTQVTFAAPLTQGRQAKNWEGIKLYLSAFSCPMEFNKNGH